eukprot:CAMPEP_0181037156 /NCGR_PEP_ID=MMETSP1070-20121207/9250_1 /TAXON_ID=265543 /ORGANISM="Minutocellus polymorphus, Strain NH13" /LENGTH=455 /DNA_ID=CAMNT_0023114851 /DNA_START=15 /DNA_END=1382 /DNA_ORIENTATION=-
MRLTAASAVLGASLMAGDVALAFAPTSSNILVTSRAAASTPLRMAAADADDAKPKKKLSVKDIMAAGNKKVEQDGPGEVKASDNFSEGILADMQSALQKLEQRAKEGPGSLSVSDVTDLESAMGRIVADLDLKLQQGASSTDAGSAAAGDDAAAAAVGSASVSSISETKPAAETTPPPPAQPAATEEDDGDEEEVDLSYDEEGPKWEGKGGMGLAKGTTNTYIIEGMEEMTGEEYRKALQKSVSDRQEQRRQTRSGVVGNRASHDYLNGVLDWGGASESLAASGPPSTGDSAPKKSHSPFKGPPKSDKQQSSPSPPPSQPTDWSKPKFLQPDPVIYHGSQKTSDTPSDGNGDEEEVDLSYDEEGPKWEGKGGMGMAKGTRNTYVIPGMEEMTGEEYREALQKSVSDRQEQRRKARRGVIGNRAGHDYLASLGWGGASESLAASSSGEVDEKETDN